MSDRISLLLTGSRIDWPESLKHVTNRSQARTPRLGPRSLVMAQGISVEWAGWEMLRFGTRGSDRWVTLEGNRSSLSNQSCGNQETKLDSTPLELPDEVSRHGTRRRVRRILAECFQVTGRGHTTAYGYFPWAHSFNSHIQCCARMAQHRPEACIYPT